MTYLAIQEIKAALILKLNEAKELSVEIRLISLLELLVPDERKVFTIEFTATEGRSKNFLFTTVKFCDFDKILRILSTEATTNSSS